MAPLAGCHIMLQGTELDLPAADDRLWERWLGEFVYELADTTRLTIIAGPEYARDGSVLCGWAIIAESHVAVHVRLPERVMFVDVFSCRKLRGIDIVVVCFRRWGGRWGWTQQHREVPDEIV